MTKLRSLTQVTSVEGVDLAYVVVDPSGTPLDRYVTVKDLLKEAWGQISVASSSWSPAATGTWEQFDEFDTAIDNGEVTATADTSGQELAIADGGRYLLQAQAAVTSASSGGPTVDMAIYWNGLSLVETELKFPFTAVPGTFNMVIPFIHHAQPGSVSIPEYELWFQSTVTNITVNSATLLCSRIS